MDLDALRVALLRDEGLRLKPYADLGGRITIGVGRNLTDRGISRSEAFELMEHDIAQTVADVDVAWPWSRALDDVRRNVLFNMAFNLGVTRLGTFRKFLDALQHHDYQRASIEMMDSKWADQVGPRATRLASEMLTGEVKP